MLAEDETSNGKHPLMKHRRPGPKHTTYGIPTSERPTVVHHVVEQKQPLRTVTAAYGVSHETICRIMFHFQKQRGQQKV